MWTNLAFESLQSTRLFNHQSVLIQENLDEDLQSALLPVCHSEWNKRHG